LLGATENRVLLEVDRHMSELAENAPVQEPVRKNKRRRRILIFCVVSLVNVGLLALLLTQLLTPAQHTAPDPLVGHPAPDFSLAMLRPGSGKSSLSLSNFKGKPVVLNFWASWCAPCKEEAPLLEGTWKQVQAQGKDIVILGVDFQDSNTDGMSFLQIYSITYPIVLDADGSVAFKYGVTSLPQTIFINRHGTVLSRVPRELTAQVLSSKLQLIM
jgi:cytochrome c biogenesis protein CcmG, thiol:disulfide interchange protein DsbE